MNLLAVGFITSGVQQIFAEMNNVCFCLVIQAGCVFLYLGVIEENPLPFSFYLLSYSHLIFVVIVIVIVPSQFNCSRGQVSIKRI